MIECPSCGNEFDSCYHEGDFTVTYVGNYFTLITATVATSHEQAERRALDNLRVEYGWDVEPVSMETSIVLEGVYN